MLCCAHDFHQFQWSWPGNHQPLHALMALLKDLEGLNPHCTEAEAIRTVFDQVICLCAPDGGGITSAVNTKDDHVSESESQNSYFHTRPAILTPRPLNEGGLEAWKLIRRVRSRLWRAALLDPDHVSTTRHDVEMLVQDQVRKLKAGQDLDLLLGSAQSLLPFQLDPGREMGETVTDGVDGRNSIVTNGENDEVGEEDQELYSMTRGQVQARGDTDPVPEVPFSYSSTFLEQTGTPYLDWQAWEALFGPLDN